ncbi:MAG: ABC transporter ATP-binding protein, partial [Bacteroidia bacterium]|nr:ABC transporter ATP-binding protein [Bacteroidia bacterium]
TYTEYRNEEAEKEEEELMRKREEKSAARKTNVVADDKVKKKISFKEKTEYEKLEKEIAALEKEKTDLEGELHLPNLSFVELSKKSERIAEIIEQLETKAIRWLELGELI